MPEEWSIYDPEQTEHEFEDVVQTGMLAQDVKQALDSLGVEPEKFNGWGEEEDGMQTLNYGQFIMPLINSVKELSAKCDSLQNEINILKGE